jgi:hypothetical protein
VPAASWLDLDFGLDCTANDLCDFFGGGGTRDGGRCDRNISIIGFDSRLLVECVLRVRDSTRVRDKDIIEAYL